MVTKKSAMTGSVFSGISAVYAVKDGFETSDGTLNLASVNLMEFPVSEESGFSFAGGEATINHFKVKGLNTDWASTFTPGDGTLTLEIPTYHTDILKLVYGQEGADLAVTLPSDIKIGGGTSVSGKAFSFDQKAVNLGLIVLNDTEDKALFIKKAKFFATPSFDGSNKPYVVTLNGTLNSGSDADGMCILEPSVGA